MRISYFSDGPRELRYATNESGVWTTEGIEVTGFGSYSALVLDDADVPHVSYRSGLEVRHATKDGGSWVTDTVDVTNGSNTSIGVDAAGVVHIAYSSASGLQVATNAGGAWATETVDAGGGWDIWLVLDTAGFDHLAFRDAADNLNYATNASGAWSVEVVGRTSPMNDPQHIALDADDIPHLVYRAPNDAAMHTWRPVPDGIDDDCDGIPW